MTSTPIAHVSINAHTIRRNATHGTDEPPIRIARSRSDKKPLYAHEIVINGPSHLVYNPRVPIMSCGARLVLLADYSAVEIVR